MNATTAICFDCDRRIVRVNATWITAIGRERFCEGREARRAAHRTETAAVRAERAAAAR